jgi:EAL domain-containing protein (putative c-di-GMP-specific phosphodiesterase class I)
VRRTETASPPSRRELDAAVAGDGLEVVFQPIVSLLDGRRVGFEALARWAHLSDGTAGDVFAHATHTGRAGVLERMCIEMAVVGALDADLPPGSAVFINCEATTPYLSRTESPILAHGAERFQIVFEVTERSLLTHPPDLLRKVVAMRREGFAFALDDVGSDPNSLALLDVLAPDVIKLDLALVQSQPHYQQARTWAAVLAHHEHAGALVLAEGIETAEHLHRALALGATLGQGFRFGRPGPPSSAASTDALPPTIRTQRPCVDPGSPFVAVGGNPILRRQRQDTVLALTAERAVLHRRHPGPLSASRGALSVGRRLRARRRRRPGVGRSRGAAHAGRLPREPVDRPRVGGQHRRRCGVS